MKSPSVPWPVGWGAVFALCAGLYISTAQQGVAWQDSGEYQNRILTGQIHSADCLARAHPLYIHIARAVYLAAPKAFPFSANALNGIFMAIVVANLFLLITRLTSNRHVAMILCATFALAHTPWWLATITETYPLSAMLFSVELLLLERWITTRHERWALWLGLCSGLGFAVHGLALLCLPVYGLIGLWMLKTRQLRPWVALGAIALWFSGGAPLWSLALQSLSADGATFNGVLHDLLVGRYGRQVTNLSLRGKYTLANAFFVSLNMATLLVPLAILGWCKAFRATFGKPLARGIAGLTIIQIPFSLRYSVPDQFMFVLPSLILITLAAAAGLTWLIRMRPRVGRIVLLVALVMALLQPLVYIGACRATRHIANRPNAAAVRDEARYWCLPWKHNETSAEDWCKGVITSLTTHPLRSSQIRHLVFLNKTTYFSLTAYLCQNPPSLKAVLGAHIVPGAPKASDFNRPLTVVVAGPDVKAPAGFTRVPFGNNLKLFEFIPTQPEAEADAPLKPCGRANVTAQAQPANRTRIPGRAVRATPPKPKLLASRAAVVPYRQPLANPLTGNYLLHLPPQYNASKDRFALCVFLHGSGERGGAIRRIETLGLPRYVRTRAGASLPMVILSPHCPAGKWWTDPEIALSVMGMIDTVCRTHRIDPDRVYLTGLSMGGEGAWFLAQHYPKRFAAVAIVCGFGGNLYLSPRIRTLPCWIFHGEADKNVSPQNSINMFKVLHKQHAPVHLTLIPKASHAIWRAVYTNPKLYEWLLQQQRPTPSVSPKPKPAATP